MKGLIIKPKWADLILSGEKTWEIRGSQTERRGTIGIIKSGTKQVFGTVELIDCISLYGWSASLLERQKDKHHVRPRDIEYKRPWAWVLRNSMILSEPIPYEHKQGCVIWVNIDEVTT